jgi:hypothetical protein
MSNLISAVVQPYTSAGASNLVLYYLMECRQCCGAGAARSRIFWLEPAPTMVLNIVRNLKMAQNVTFYNPLSSYFYQYKSYRII